MIHAVTVEARPHQDVYSCKTLTAIMESYRLLATNDKDEQDRPMEKITELELAGITLSEEKPRSFSREANNILIQEDDIETPYGNVHVAIQGDRAKPAIITYHDVGLNHVTCFQGFFSYPDMQPILRHFCVFHLNAPGQEEGALHLKPQQDALGNPDSLGSRFVYPTMEQLAETIGSVMEHYNLKRFIGFGVGLGSNILSRYALKYPDHIDSLLLVNGTCGPAGWIEWGYQKLNSFYLFGGHMTNFTEEYLLWHWFGKKTRWENHDLVHVFQEYVKSLNPQNLALFIQSYIKRNDLGLVRELDAMKKSTTRNIKGRCMLIVGDDSPHINEVVTMNGHLDPAETEFLKIADCGGMPLEEQPGKVCEAFRLFLQGQGYIPAVSQSRSSSTHGNLNRHASLSSPLADSQVVSC